MTSNRRIAANRRNTVSSTGPRTSAGKMRSSRNALKHGLATSIAVDPMHAQDIEQLAKAIAGETSDKAGLALSRVAAEAELEMLRVRAYRIALINADLNAIHKEAKTGSSGADIQGQASSEPLLCTIDKLAHLERYERRAYSRRKRAFRELQTYLAGQHLSQSQHDWQNGSQSE
jgi:hypothetical protein